MKRMLLVFAHPDDETFSCGVTIAKYVKAGWTVDLICATHGENGEMGPYDNLNVQSLGEIRQKELERAAELLGISSVIHLDYIDGTLHDVTPGELEEKIYTKMTEFTPDVVITFDTSGVSNHPDHIRISYAATFAFQKYAVWTDSVLKDHPEYDEEAAPKLYYACIPESTVTYMVKMKVFPEESFGKLMAGIEDKNITTVISGEGFQMLKRKVLKGYISQSHDVSRFLSLKNNPLIAREYFVFRLHGIREIFMGKHDRISSHL